MAGDLDTATSIKTEGLMKGVWNRVKSKRKTFKSETHQNYTLTFSKVFLIEVSDGEKWYHYFWDPGLGFLNERTEVKAKEMLHVDVVSSSQNSEKSADSTKEEMSWLSKEDSDLQSKIDDLENQLQSVLSICRMQETNLQNITWHNKNVANESDRPRADSLPVKENPQQDHASPNTHHNDPPDQGRYYVNTYQNTASRSPNYDFYYRRRPPAYTYPNARQNWPQSNTISYHDVYVRDRPPLNYQQQFQNPNPKIVYQNKRPTGEGSLPYARSRHEGSGPNAADFEARLNQLWPNAAKKLEREEHYARVDSFPVRRRQPKVAGEPSHPQLEGEIAQAGRNAHPKVHPRQRIGAQRSAPHKKWGEDWHKPVDLNSRGANSSNPYAKIAPPGEESGRKSRSKPPWRKQSSGLKMGPHDPAGDEVFTSFKKNFSLRKN